MHVSFLNCRSFCVIGVSQRACQLFGCCGRLPAGCCTAEPSLAASGLLSYPVGFWAPLLGRFQRMPTSIHFILGSRPAACLNYRLGFFFLPPLWLVIFFVCGCIFDFGMSNIPPGNMYSSETPYLLLASSRIVTVPGAYFVAVDRACFPAQIFCHLKKRTGNWG